jgi:hypothetical protein
MIVGTSHVDVDFLLGCFDLSSHDAFLPQPEQYEACEAAARAITAAATVRLWWVDLNNSMQITAGRE